LDDVLGLRRRDRQSEEPYEDEPAAVDPAEPSPCDPCKTKKRKTCMAA
jgi:hypothetical protein